MSEDLGFIFIKKINTLAALFYRSDGKKFDPTIDFRNSNHPEEQGCWNKAIIAYAVIGNDSGLLEFQV
jgi:hypothetical protein